MELSPRLVLIALWPHGCRREGECSSRQEPGEDRTGKGLPWRSRGCDPVLPKQGLQVRSLVRELDPTCLNFRMLQLKILRAAANTQCSQMKKKKEKGRHESILKDLKTWRMCWNYHIDSKHQEEMGVTGARTGADSGSHSPEHCPARNQLPF